MLRLPAFVHRAVAIRPLVSALYNPCGPVFLQSVLSHTCIMAPKNIGNEYSSLMNSWGKGFAFYQLPDSDEVRIGSFGFVSDTGIWKLIAHLTDKESVADAQFSPFDYGQKLKPKEAIETEWGPKLAGKVVNYGGSINVSGQYVISHTVS
jgi:hypothetical protein